MKPKVGADDFIASGIREADLVQLPREDVAEPPRRGEPEPVELTELLDRTYPDDPGPVGGGIAVRGGLVIVGGGPKLGKSCLVSNMLIRRHRGEPWLGFATTAGRTFIANAEIPEPELQQRLRLQLQDGAPLPVGSIYCLTDRRMKLDRPECVAKLRQHLNRVKPDLLVLDPLARFLSGDENSAKDMGVLVAALDVLIQEYGLSIIVVHHTGKPGPDAREGGHRLRGSSALFAAADSVLLLDRSEGGFRLAFELRHAKAPEPMRLERTDTLWFMPTGPPEDLLAVAASVRRLPLAWGQLVAAIKADQDVSKATAERLVQRALKARMVAKNEDGQYIASLTLHHGASEGERSAHA